MMPSRGIHVARGKLPRISQRQCRNFSSTPRPALRIASSYARSSITHTSNLWMRSIPIAFPTFAAIRHASTTPASAQQAQQTTEAAAAAATHPPPSSTTSFSNFDTINLDNIDVKQGFVDPSTIPEHIGYLKEIGLDSGYGPTSVIQWVLEHSHITLGLPWWGAICLTAFSMRLVLFPFFIKQSDMMARQQALTSVMKPFYERMQQAQKEGNTAAVMQALSQIGAIKKRAGISNTGQFGPIIGQGILGYCGFRLMKAMATLPVPGLRDGGFYWITDLTVTDGFLVLPAVMAATMHVVARTGGESGAMVLTPGTKKLLLYAMPALIFIITSWQPGAVAIWFCGSGLVGISQGKLLQNAKVRERLGIAPLYKPKEGEGFAGGMMGALAGSKYQNALQRAERGGNVAPAATAAASGATAGTNAAFMSPTYQAPKIHTQRNPGTIDAELVKPQQAQRTTDTKGEMIQPGKAKSGFSNPFAGISEAAKAKFAETKRKALLMTEQSEADKKAAARKAFKKQAAEYEERARQRGKR